MGADRAILVESPDTLEPLDVAKTLLAVVGREQPLLVLMGKQAIDHDHSQTGQMLAALWGRPQATFASGIEVTGSVARVSREVDAGIETIDIDLPAVVTTDLRLNEPRFVRLPEILKAKKKPLETQSLVDLGVVPESRVRMLCIDPPPERNPGTRVESVAELVAELQARSLL